MIAENANAVNLDKLADFVAGLRPAMKRQYDRGVNRDLSQQQSQYMFKRNVTAVLQQTYQQALSELQQLRFDHEQQDKADGECGLGSQVLKSFDGIIEELIVYALQKHRTSCALSNFPDEHNPGQDYIAEVIEEASNDWSAFVAQVNAMFSS